MSSFFVCLIFLSTYHLLFLLFQNWGLNIIILMSALWFLNYFRDLFILYLLRNHLFKTSLVYWDNWFNFLNIFVFILFYFFCHGWLLPSILFLLILKGLFVFLLSNKKQINSSFRIEFKLLRIFRKPDFSWVL